MQVCQEGIVYHILVFDVLQILQFRLYVLVIKTITDIGEVRMALKLGKGANENYSVDVVIAALNEEIGIGLTVHEMLQNITPKRVLVIDGHSCDRTVEVAKDMGATIMFQDGIGKGDAIAKAVNTLDLDVDYIVVTDADYTYPAEFVPEMIQILEQNPKVGMVCGNRFNPQTEEKTFRGVFHLGNKLIALSHNLFNGVSLQDPLTGLRVIRSSVLRNWKVRSKGFDIEVELNQWVERSGYEIREIPIKYRKRLGEKKLKISDGATIFKRILQNQTFLEDQTKISPSQLNAKISTCRIVES